MNDWLGDFNFLAPLEELLINIIYLITDVLEAITSWLPNPDPFRSQTYHVDENPFLSFAAYWMDVIWDMEYVVNIGVAMFEMFTIAWIIMALWKWLKMR